MLSIPGPNRYVVGFGGFLLFIDTAFIDVKKVQSIFKIYLQQNPIMDV